ncbi:MAG: GNAT family N-acetyltransferase [Catenulispora sp.]|nr:GNAT family N-acetyltransferase [Catenulispora sp.]
MNTPTASVPSADGAQVHALLADGTTVLIRPSSPEDLDGLSAMFAALTQDAVRMRFFTVGQVAGRQAARRLCAVDPDRIALLAVAHRGDGEDEVIGEAEAWPIADGEAAEIGFTVAEGMRGRGVGTLLLEHLAGAAKAAGFRRFVAETLRTNTAMNRVIAAAGLHHTTVGVDDQTVFHEIDLTVDDAYLDRVADREFRASAASLAPLLRPRSVAVIGAGRTRGGVGRAILENIVGSGYDGALFAVNPFTDVIGTVPCVRSVELLPEPMDLAIVAVPPEQVVDAVIACGRRGVRTLTVVTTPISPATRAVLLATCRRFGMRLVGPNCLGVASFSHRAAGAEDSAELPLRGPARIPALGTDFSLDATFAADIPLRGSAGVGVQSGGVGISIMEHLSRLGIGVGSFVSLGDKADVSGNDLLAWWSQDPDTKIALLHLESFGNARKFARYARRLARSKPVLTVAAGRSAAGSRAAASHTAAAVTPVITREELFRQAGVIPARSVAELIETAALLATQPPPAGRRIAVVSNAGGTGVLAADACADAGLRVEEFGAELRKTLGGLLGPVATTANPVDAGAGVGAGELRAAVEAIAASGEADAILLLLVPTALTDLQPVLTRGVEHGTVPLVAVQVNQGAGVDIVEEAHGERIPAYGDAEEAARALAHACSYAEWLKRPEGETPKPPGIRSQDAARIASLYLDAHPEGGWLPPDRAADLLACYGIKCARLVLARDEKTAVTTAAIWDGPVAMKAYWPGLVHKSDVGGVLLGLSGEQAVREGWRTLSERFGDQLVGVAVQEMAPRGVELLAGVDSDEVFGPLIAFGTGGTETDLASDKGFRLAPLTDADAADLVGSTQAARLLAGFRGRPGGDADAVRDVLLRLARLAAEQTTVAEAEINPLIATPDGVVATDFRIRLERRATQDPYLRRLR